MSKSYDTSNKTIFIDESGNFGFDFSKSGTSSHFIITAIIINTTDVEFVRNQVNDIKKKYIQNGELKSSRIKIMGKRYELLNAFSNINFKIFTLVVDKRKLDYFSPLTEYKKSFFMFLNNILYKELKRLDNSIDFFADNYGNTEFMNRFKIYINKTLPYSFYEQYKFEFRNSNDEPLIQLADFIAGTLSYGYEENKICSEYKGFYALIKDRLEINYWPIEHDNYISNFKLIDKNKYDEKIAEYCIGNATKYISENHKSNDEYINDRISILRYFLNEMYVLNPNHYIHIAELIDYISKNTGRKYTNHQFNSNIIAKLRDSGIIISSNQQGLKIPVNAIELFSYAERTLGQVLPMLSRLQKARKRILFVTDNDLDLLDDNKYNALIQYLDNEQ